MPIYRFQMPDGRVARVQADDPDAASQYAGTLTSAPKPGASQGKARSPEDQQTYLTELAKARQLNSQDQAQTARVKNTPIVGGAIDKLNSFAAGEMGPIAGELSGVLSGGGNMAANLYRRATGQPQVSSRAIYEASRDAMDEEVQHETSANPISAGVGSVAGLLSATGELSKGVGLLKGLPSVVKAGEKVAAGAKALPGATRTAAAIDAAKALAKANVNPSVLKYGGNVAKGVGIGGATGAALGFAQGDDLDSRLQNAAETGQAGMEAGGLLEGVAAPLAKPFIGAGKDLARGIITKLRPAVPAGAVTTADALAARKAVGEIAQQAGVTSDNLAARTAPYDGLDQTGAEALGSSGQNMLASVARRGGTTGDNLRAQVRARTISQPQAIMGDFELKLGVDPQAAQGDIEHMVEAGRAKAGPEFKSYFDATAGGVTDPEVERLLATPMGQKLAGGIQRFARNTGRPQEGLTFGRVETPETAQGVDPNAPPPPEPTVRRAPSAAPSRGLSLVDWLRRQGGVGGEGAGEMAAMDAGSVGARSRMSPQDLDTLAEKAQDAGYFPASAEGVRPTHVELLDAIKAELGGSPRYAREADPAAQQRFEGANADEEAIYRGVRPGEPEITEDSYGGSGVHAPAYEPAMQELLTGEALDRIRRRANKSVKFEFGKPVRTGPQGVANEEPAAFAQDMTAALKAGPHGEKLATALQTSSDYLGISKAFDNFKGQLINGTPSSFMKSWARLKPGAEQDAARGALAHDVIDLWGRGQLKGGKFATPGIQQKLTIAFGEKGAKAFVQQMERRAELAASGARMAPFSGSPTMSLQEAAGAANEMAPLASNIARIGAKLFKNPLAAAGDAIGTAANYAKTSGTTTGFRNELGRILSLPSNDPELVGLLKEMETLTPAEQADVLKVMGLGVTGGVAAHQTKHD